MTLFDAPREDETATANAAVVKVVLAYDGTGFRGFAAQPGQRTVAGVLQTAIETALQHDVELACAGRTDSGVHAWGQVVSFEAVGPVDAMRLKNSINSMLAPEVVARSCETVGPGFDARHSAEWRCYRYTVVNRPEPDPFLDRYAWFVGEPLDLRAMRLAADPFIGQHDFASFCRKREGATATRRVLSSRWTDQGEGVLRYEIRAHAFCQQMVRSIVGTQVDVGLGRRTPGDMLTIIRAADRNAAGNVAPPKGLCLWEVGYGE